MLQEYPAGCFPHGPSFAYRFFNCLHTVCGQLCKQEFISWYHHISSHRGRRAFLRVASRIWFITSLRLESSNFTERWRELSLGGRRRLLKKYRRQQCHVWKNPYELYKQLCLHKISLTEFSAFWNQLNHSERTLILDEWWQLIEKSSYSVQLRGLDDDANIVIRASGGPDSAIRVF